MTLHQIQFMQALQVFKANLIKLDVAYTSILIDEKANCFMMAINFEKTRDAQHAIGKKIDSIEFTMAQIYGREGRLLRLEDDRIIIMIRKPVVMKFCDPKELAATKNEYLIANPN